ncbi:MAG TPA: bifunctional histidinol-phosphatase/imidazoleglycerol-phosphate dehydratase HisB [Steroidobacteraceae bacterium]|nr:bifunctional histidinol-phosphatase/imidazoleglycerol-phosphate dehydratase HisB [Steroidobacteraceae bacterium]
MTAAASTLRPTLLVDRDGTLIEEPPDQQVDRLEKIRLLPGVVAALAELQKAGYRLVMVSNQDGLGSEGYPTAHFEQVQAFLLELFASQGVHFDAVFICPHFAHERCACRKPLTGLLTEDLRAHPLDPAGSAMVGDRHTDLQFAANLGVRGILLGRPHSGGLDATASSTASSTAPADAAPVANARADTVADWPAVVRLLLARSAPIARRTRETQISGRVELDSSESSHIRTGIGFFDHMLEQLAKHGGFHLTLECRGDLHIDEHHTVEDCALALGEALRRALADKSGIGRYGFLLPMDESEAQVAIDLSGRAYFVFEGQFSREQVGGLPTELVPHFFRSLAESLGAALHLQVRGENTHHMIEACFKGVGRALRPALARQGLDLPSTKGML